jgi:hypothetical protein
MKTDEDVIEGLRRASRAVKPSDRPLESLHRRRATKRRRQRLAAALVAMTVFVAGVGGSLFALRGVLGGQRDVTGSGWTPSRSLELQPGQYFYLNGLVLGTGDGSRIQQETWWAPDGSGELRFDTDRPDKYVSWPPEGIYGKGEFPLEDLSSLSTDQVILEEQLRERAAEEGTSVWRTIVNLTNVERFPNALPELRAALFDVAAQLEGATREDDVEDPVGRDAVSLAMTDEDGLEWELFFDPGTHQLMAQAVAFGEGQPVPFLIVESGIVDARGAEPTDGQRLFPRPARDVEPPVQPSPSLP